MTPPINHLSQSRDARHDKSAVTPFDAEPVRGRIFTEEEIKARKAYFSRLFAPDDRADDTL